MFLSYILYFYNINKVTSSQEENTVSENENKFNENNLWNVI